MTPSPAAVRALAARLGGRAAHRDDDAWDSLAASRFPNLEVPWAPDVVVHAAGTADVIAATHFAREHNLGLAVRSGGVGWIGAPPGALLIDLRDMHTVHVDPGAEPYTFKEARSGARFTASSGRLVLRPPAHSFRASV